MFISSSSIWVGLDPFSVRRHSLSLLGAGESLAVPFPRKVGMAKLAQHLPAAFSSLCTRFFSPEFGEDSRAAGICSLQGYKVSPGLLRTS